MMKRVLVLFIIVYVIGSRPIYAQNCLPSGIVFSNQTQIDEFVTNFPGCKTIEGNVRIEESIPNNIINLNGLINLEKIGGNMVLFGNNSLPDLNGLNNLDTIIGDLTIQANSKLDSLKGLDKLKYIGKNIYIGETRIKNLKWIENLDTIKGIFNIEYNDSLKNFSGLNSLKYIGKSVLIIGNPALSNISTLNNISKIKGNLFIHANTVLNDLSGLSSLDSVSGSIEIWNNKALTSISGLNSLKFIGINLAIGSNQNLINLNGINTLDSIGGYLEISNNTALQTLSGLEMLNSTGGFVSISSNPALQNLNGLNNLKKIHGNLTLFLNQNLNNITALTNIHSIAGVLYIGYNYSLTSLIGLDNFDSNNLTELVIKNSGILSFCNTSAICSFLQNPNNITNISSNASGCNSRSEVEILCGIMPLKIIDFSAKYSDNQDIMVEWTVESEYDVDRYEIEFSYDGFNFINSGYKKGINNRGGTTKYTYFKDLNSEIGYCRLKIIDYNGTFIYSDIVSLRNNKSMKNMDNFIYPNPADDIIFFDNAIDGKIKIFTPDGHQILVENCTNCKSININYLKEGLYILNIEGKYYSRAKFVKK